jgi:hypothetical protein
MTLALQPTLRDRVLRPSPKPGIRRLAAAIDRVAIDLTSRHPGTRSDRAARRVCATSD